MKMLTLPMALLLAACSLTIDETSVFQPQGERAPALDVAELSRWPDAELRSATPDVEIRHGFIGEGEARIAYTLATRAGENRPLIVHCGGNAADRYNSGVGYVRKALPYGDVLVFDYPGYGDSAGQPNAAAMEDMSRRVATFAVALMEERPLVFWGHSLGGFVCSQAAGRTPQADAVVLEATARRASEVADAVTPWYADPFVRINVADTLAGYDVARALANFDGPVLVLGARRDDTLPIRLSRSLVSALEAQSANVTYVEFPDAGHSSISRQSEFAPTLSAFFSQLEEAP